MLEMENYGHKDFINNVFKQFSEEQIIALASGEKIDEELFRGLSIFVQKRLQALHLKNHQSPKEETNTSAYLGHLYNTNKELLGAILIEGLTTQNPKERKFIAENLKKLGAKNLLREMSRSFILFTKNQFFFELFTNLSPNLRAKFLYNLWQEGDENHLKNSLENILGLTQRVHFSVLFNRQAPTLCRGELFVNPLDLVYEENKLGDFFDIPGANSKVVSLSSDGMEIEFDVGKMLAENYPGTNQQTALTRAKKQLSNWFSDLLGVNTNAQKQEKLTQKQNIFVKIPSAQELAKVIVDKGQNTDFGLVLALTLPYMDPSFSPSFVNLVDLSPQDPNGVLLNVLFNDPNGKQFFFKQGYSVIPISYSLNAKGFAILTARVLDPQGKDLGDCTTSASQFFASYLARSF